MINITMAAMGLGEDVATFFTTIDVPNLGRIYFGANDFDIKSVAKFKAKFAHLKDRTIS